MNGRVIVPSSFSDTAIGKRASAELMSREVDLLSSLIVADSSWRRELILSAIWSKAARWA